VANWRSTPSSSNSGCGNGSSKPPPWKSAGTRDKERAFSDLLSDLDLHHPPCQDLQSNRIFYALATLAYNALLALKLIHLPESEQPKRVRTLIRHLLLVPVELTRHARQLKACLYLPAGWIAWWRGYLAQWLPQCRQLGTIASGG
jgi:hypothetical protein